ncbi:MAG: proliferating cell nuclear antigen (pcna) [Nitrosopumilus sp.]|nr:proliferating cell nuclear antigen (pcna) [Nitrosopumilus sp.]CAI9830865.1 DNA polymerase sliding clamp [Nitrosopumilaceae archaeon]MDA7941120.1 proliferating cell nuclear antigen (pcna) [Nitrosopumilus sp.]MDA7942482.1 proliferating cell nuclear antigen (pcna) [Nitrosopumilus sp.]MDA7944559.1 proliferating cell nuclear antigen (pcna) [Nitrosopumilus sp.]
MTFEAKTGGSDDLKAVISAISTLVEEATFEATPEGITFRGMDPSHVALIDIEWPNSAFEKYECDEQVNFGVRIDEFSKIIKRAEKKDDIRISIEDSMLVVAVGKNKKYRVRLIESSATDTPLPKIQYEAKLVLASPKFDKALGDVGVVSDYLTIRVSKSGADFSGKGDSGEVEIAIDKDDEGTKEVTAKAECTGTYSLEYLNPVIKAVGNTASEVACEFSNSKPLRIEFKVANIGRIHFYLAPRVES